MPLDAVLSQVRVKTIPAPKVVYCLSQNVTLLTVWPRAFVPVAVIVRVFPSLDTTKVCVTVLFPAFL
jgi:hypothetical protein